LFIRISKDVAAMPETIVLQGIGFFYRLPGVDRLHVLNLLSRPEPLQDEAAIASYLDAGVVFAATPGVEEDPLIPGTPFAGALHIRTDGRYAWPQTLSYWVRKHHVALPDPFLEYIRGAGYRIPSSINPEKLVLPPMC
jgi:hypothetical protein